MRSETRSHDPCYSCTPHRGSASQLQSHRRPWHRWHTRSRCGRRARMKCNPNEHLCACRCATQAGACMQPACQRQLHGSGHPTHTAITEQWPTSRIPSPACLSTHGTLAWLRWVRVPTGCVRIPRRSNVGGGGKDSVKITEIGNMALFCLFHIRGNNISKGVTMKPILRHGESLRTDDR